MIEPHILARLRAGLAARFGVGLEEPELREPPEPAHPDRPAEPPEQTRAREAHDLREVAAPALPQSGSWRRSPGAHASEEANAGHAYARRWGTECSWCLRGRMAP